MVAISGSLVSSRVCELLIQARDRIFEARVPLRTMGVVNARQTKITIGDAQWPKSAIFSLEAQQYR